MQTLQNIHPTRNKQPHTNKTTKTTPHNNHMPKLRQTHKNPNHKKGEKTQHMNKPTPTKKRHNKHKLPEEKPAIRIGKNGTTQQLLKEIQKQLDKQETVKVKILKTALSDSETKQIASKIADQTAATLTDIRGHTFTLYKPHNT
jgi:putative YhbY family RNA-binding protein